MLEHRRHICGPRFDFAQSCRLTVLICRISWKVRHLQLTTKISYAECVQSIPSLWNAH